MGRLQPVLAGVVTAVVGFTGAFSVVLAGLAAAGADHRQAGSGLFALCVTMGLAAIWLGWRHRMPISIAWSTPGAALLLSTGQPPGGWPAAIGAFLVTGLLIVLAGAWRRLGDAIAAIPGTLASAMLAGVLLPICLAPARSVVAHPGLTAPMIVAWALLAWRARRWAVPGAIVVATAAIVIDHGGVPGTSALGLPVLDLVTPRFTAGALIGIALPLFLVTMASQNLAGMAVLASFGYRPPLRPILVSTGAATVVGAPLGGHAVNLAAITAALAAGPDADPDPDRRWIASVTAGALYLVIGVFAGFVAAFMAGAPALFVEAIAGVALLGALAGALAAAMADPADRDAALVTLVVSASGISAFGVSAPFWGLVAGMALRALLRAPTRRRDTKPEPRVPA
jgi:benzoate membrane transport protein